MKFPYDLSRKTGCEPCLPCNPGEYCPTVHLDGSEDFQLPESGLVTFRFKRESKNENDRDGKKSFSVCLGLKEIVAVKADKKAEADDEESTSEALDRLRDEVESEKE